MFMPKGEFSARAGRPLLICDLTQSYSPAGGGGISTYLREKREWLLANTPHTLLQIVPGPEDRVTRNGRHIFAEVRAPLVPGSPNYRFILRTWAVHALLEEYMPDVIESLCPWVLPWVAIGHRRKFPKTALVAGYRTDFPNAHVYRVGREKFGERIAHFLREQVYGYARDTYREFDWVYTLSEDARKTLGGLGIRRTSVLPLGVDAALFNPARANPDYRRKLGLDVKGPLLIYAGRIDNEKRADRLVAMFRRLPKELDAGLVMLGDGKLRERLMAESAGLPIAYPGFEKSREDLSRALASSDIYVSAMADETFGVSVLEAQAAGLPVVGVASGAMPDRVPAGAGLLGPVDDVDAMAANVVALWNGDRHATARRARETALRFAWPQTFATLLEDIYPAAFDARAQRLSSVDSRVWEAPARQESLVG